MWTRWFWATQEVVFSIWDRFSLCDRKCLAFRLVDDGGTGDVDVRAWEGMRGGGYCESGLLMLEELALAKLARFG